MNTSKSSPSSTSFEKEVALFYASKGEDTSVALPLLERMRSASMRESRIVVDIVSVLLEKHLGKLVDEKWVILEQALIAALDIGDFTFAKKCLSELHAKFPNSRRVDRLQGLMYDANQQYDAALKIYAEMIETDPTDMIALKRKACVYQSMGDTKKAIALFAEYLTVFMSDYDAWTHLAGLYLDEQMYSQALFCFEEVIIGSPQNFHYYIKAAEIKYTLGSVDDLLEAAKYFSYAIELSQTEHSPGNLRALYGLVVTAKALSEQSKGSVSNELTVSAAWAQEQISKIYQGAKVASEVKQIAHKSLQSLQFS